MKRSAGLLVRVGAAVVVATALTVWTAVPGGPAPAVPAAQAGSEWCDADPVRLFRADDGQLLPVVVFYTPGAQIESLLELPRILALLTGTLLKVSSTSESVPDGMRLTLRVTVPTGAGPAYPTRLVVSQGFGGTLTRYAEVYGRSGQEMVARFLLPAA
jgi:hypothetical protein